MSDGQNHKACLVQRGVEFGEGVACVVVHVTAIKCTNWPE